MSANELTKEQIESVLNLNNKSVSKEQISSSLNIPLADVTRCLLKNSSSEVKMKVNARRNYPKKIPYRRVSYQMQHALQQLLLQKPELSIDELRKSLPELQEFSNQSLLKHLKQTRKTLFGEDYAEYDEDDSSDSFIGNILGIDISDSDEESDYFQIPWTQPKPQPSEDEQLKALYEEIAQLREKREEYALQCDILQAQNECVLLNIADEKDKLTLELYKDSLREQYDNTDSF